MNKTSVQKVRHHTYPLIDPDERLAALRAIRGMWKDRKSDPIKELNKMRKEWERKLPWAK